LLLLLFVYHTLEAIFAIISYHRPSVR